MKRFLVSIFLVLAVGACKAEAATSKTNDWFVAYGLVTDSLTEYLEYEPEPNGSFEENMKVARMYLSNLQTAQLTFEKYNQNGPLELSDGTISKNSVIALNQALEEFVLSQEQALDLLQSCDEYMDSSEEWLCFLMTFDAISTETNARYAEVYSANQAFMQDSLD